MILTPEECERYKKSIEEAKKTLSKGLIVDYEAASQLRRMIAYYQEQIDESEAQRKKK